MAQSTRQKTRPFFMLIVISVMAAVVFLPGPADAQSLNVYVNELPEWASYAEGVMAESTLFWEEHIPGLRFYLVDDPLEADFRVQWVKEFGVEHVGYAYGSKFIEVGLGDSNCGGNWNPFSAGYVAHIMKHEIGHVLGYQHSNDPDDIMYPVALNIEYGLVEKEISSAPNYGHFIPFCTSKQVTSFDYHISTDDPTYGFDVYVVPGADSFNKWSELQSFEYYSDDSCHGRNYLEYGGTCEGVTQSSGVLIVTGDTQTRGLTTLTVQLQESFQTQGKSVKPNTATPPKSDPAKPAPGEVPSQDPNPPNEAGTIDSDRDTYVVGYSDIIYAKVFGTVNDVKRGDKVTLTITYPGSTTDGNHVSPTDQGYYESLITLNNLSPKGTYEVFASVGGKILGTVTFDVVDKKQSAPAITADETGTDKEQTAPDREQPTTDKEQAAEKEQTAPDREAGMPREPEASFEFVNPAVDPYHYVNRYHSDAEYRDWFDSNYPDHSIYQAVGLGEPLEFVDRSKDPQYYLDRYFGEQIYRDWFDSNYPDYTIYEAVGIPNPIVPSWIKSNIHLWSQDRIDDATFVNGIQFMIENNIIQIPNLPEPSGETPQAIPSWLKANAELYHKGVINDEAFVSIVKYLVESGVITV